MYVRPNHTIITEQHYVQLVTKCPGKTGLRNFISDPRFRYWIPRDTREEENSDTRAMEEKLERMTEMMGDGCNTVTPSGYCDTSEADKV